MVVWFWDALVGCHAWRVRCGALTPWHSEKTSSPAVFYWKAGTCSGCLLLMAATCLPGGKPVNYEPSCNYVLTSTTLGVSAVAAGEQRDGLPSCFLLFYLPATFCWGSSDNNTILPDPANTTASAWKPWQYNGL
jgi:hypothetical protein